jgi:molybdopterin converting factor small subunit
MSVTVLVPSALAGFAGGRREVELDGPGDGATTVAGVLDRLADQLPALERRLRDERSAIRRHVNVYVDGTDIRDLSGPETAVPDGATVQVIAAVSGG